MQKEITLRDATTETAKTQYEVTLGSLSKLSGAQKNNLLALAQEHDALDRQDKKWAALIESANAYYDIKKSNKDLIQSDQIQSGFNEQLARNADALAAGDFGIGPEAQRKFKEQMDMLAKAYNEDFIDPSITKTDEMSQAAIQGARNIQNAFADFLFDPFNTSIGSLADNFATAIRRMAANVIAAKIGDLLKESFSGLGSGGGGGFWAWLTGLFSSGAAGGVAAAAAKGLVFANSNVIPFSRGGIFHSPAYFSMADNKIGLLGEAGPEAIMPLDKTSDGKLGINAHHAGGGKTIIMPLTRGRDGKLGISYPGNDYARMFRTGDVFRKNENHLSKFSRVLNNSVTAFNKGGVFATPISNSMIAPVNSKEKTQNLISGPAVNITVNVQGGIHAPDVKRAAGQGAREAIGLMKGAARYG